jgi:hypothetical protein
LITHQANDDYLLSAFVYQLRAFIICLCFSPVIVGDKTKEDLEERKERQKIKLKRERQQITNIDSRRVMQQILWMGEFEVDSCGSE